MIITLSILFVVLVVSLWIYTMYTLWQKEEGQMPALFSTDPFARLLVKLSRRTRRTFYRFQMVSKVVMTWANKRFSQGFLKVFPKAQPAFAKRNTLTGLKEGPTSYFLMSISETKAEAPKPRRRKKIV